MTQIRIDRTTSPKARPAAGDALPFGRIFTDHMFLMNYDEGRGWHDPRVVPYAPFSLDPATCVLHYAQAIFDGMKAFRGADDVVRLFRTEAHAARINRSCAQLCIPQLDESLVQESIHALVATDLDWVPGRHGTALYLRPTVIATEAFLGVRPARSYLYFVIASPVGAYYPEGLAPVKILATDTHVRAVRGGLGAAKTAGNYANSIFATEAAHQAGFTQVLWLDGVEHTYLEEVGTMNIMLRIEDEIITPPLAGTILPGITRDSVLTLLRDWGLRVSERQISITEVMQAAADGRLREMWGTGTAAVISPVGELGFHDQIVRINNGQTGELTQRLYDAVTALQYGRANDPHHWLHPVRTELARAA